MHVNTSVVKALMYLRGLGEPTVANLVNSTLEDFQAWLYDIGEDSENRVPFDAQLEVLRLLGIHGEGPRPDVVHYWRIHEPLFSQAVRSYWALNIVLKAFGKAQAVYIAREADPAFTLQAKAHFGLRFEGFMAILEVTAHPLRSISFDPETMPDLSWVPDTFGVLLPEAEFLKLQPGQMKVKGFTQYLTYTTEMAQWERLREAALENGIRAEQVASLLLGSSAGPLLEGNASTGTMGTKAEAASSEPAAETEAPAPASERLFANRPAAAAAAPAEEPVPTAKHTAEIHSLQDVRGGSDDMSLFVRPVQKVPRAN